MVSWKEPEVVMVSREGAEIMMVSWKRMEIVKMS